MAVMAWYVMETGRREEGKKRGGKSADVAATSGLTELETVFI